MGGLTLVIDLFPFELWHNVLEWNRVPPQHPSAWE